MFPDKIVCDGFDLVKPDTTLEPPILLIKHLSVPETKNFTRMK